MPITGVAKPALLGGAVGIVLLSMSCTALGSDYQEGTRPTAPAIAARDHCPSSADQVPGQDDDGQPIGPGRLPDNFDPVRAVRCSWSERYLDDAATRSELTVEEFRSPSITSALSASLELPDQEFTAWSHGACPAIARAPEYLILVDAGGTAYRPRLPQSPCGDPRDEVVRAVADLPWAAYTTYVFETHA